MTRPVVEILYFEGCPHYTASAALVRQVAAELGVEPDVRTVNVGDAAEAARERFLGSPTIRVEGRDVEPGADERTDYVLGCRVYRTERGQSAQPHAKWVKAALRTRS